MTVRQAGCREVSAPPLLLALYSRAGAGRDGDRCPQDSGAVGKGMQEPH